MFLMTEKGIMTEKKQVHSDSISRAGFQCIKITLALYNNFDICRNSQRI